MMSDVLESIVKMAEKVTQSEGLSLFDVELKGQGRGKVLRIYIDSPRGITLEDCKNISQQMSHLLDIEDVIEGSYVLEISSPGLERKLRNEEDYLRYIGRLLKIKTRNDISGERVFKARLVSFQNNVLLLEDRKKRRFSIPYSSILEGRLEVEF